MMSKNFEGVTLKTQQFVDAFGSEIQKRSYSKTKKLAKNTKISIIKTAEQKYPITEIKEGGLVYYQIGSKRPEKREREDRRITNGDWSNGYVKNMDIIVAAKLDKEKVLEGPRTLGTWLQYFELISPLQLKLLKSIYDENLKYKLLRSLKESQIVLKGEEKIFDDYQDSINKHKGELLSTLSRMKKIGIIDIIEEYRGVYGVIEIDIEKELENVPNSEKAYLKEVLIAKNKALQHLEDVTSDLNVSMYKELCMKKKILQNEYNVTEFKIKRYKYSKNVKAYNDAWKKCLNDYTLKHDLNDTYQLKYFYKVYNIRKKGEENKLVKYLEKFNLELLKGYKTLTLAEQYEFLNDNRIKYVENHAIEIIMKAEIKACAFLNRKVKEIKLSEETKEAIELGILTENQIDEQVVKTREDYFELTDSSYFELYYNGLYARKIAELEKVYQIQFLEDNG